MAVPAQFVKHIESYVDSASSLAQQAAGVDAIATLLKNNVLTLESLVREMEMYLTTSDSIIRSRGILLLAEVLTHLASKPLDYSTIHSLIGFFTERLADWRALRGALVGCLTLMRRKDNVGAVSKNEALAVVQSYLQNLQVQSLGQHDRKLCFELLECILDHYSDALIPMGDMLVYGICEAIDGEKDPQCLMIAFHILESLARVFPDAPGSLESFAEDLFDIFGCYFPIHFFHSKAKDVAVKREDLSRALMMAFASMPFFEPYAIPLLLEKLSSSLPSAKIESLKYLSYCAIKYGADRMAKHVEALWSSIKSSIYTLSSNSESLDGMGFKDDEIIVEALTLLQNLVMQNNELFSRYVLGDEDIKETIQSLTTLKRYEDISIQSTERLHAVGYILSVLVKASNTSCNSVFESFFPHLMNVLGLSLQHSFGDCYSDVNRDLSMEINFGALYLCVELLAACRYLVISSNEPTTASVSEPWCCLLRGHCDALIKTFSSLLEASSCENNQNAYICSAVKGLQSLATFPGGFPPVPECMYEAVLLRFMSIITSDFSNTTLWKLVLKSITEIGSFVNEQKSEKIDSFEEIVVERAISLLLHDDAAIPLSLKLEAVANIGMAGLKFMLKFVQGLDSAISAKFPDAYANGSLKSAEVTILLLDCYSMKVLPWFNNIADLEEVQVCFAVSIWKLIENSMSSVFLEKKLLEATMMAMKLAVAGCSPENQSIIIQTGFRVLSSRTSFLLKDSAIDSIQPGSKDFQLIHYSDGLSCEDDWIISLFASAILALRPQTNIPNVKVIVQLFLSTLLNGHVSSAQALGSLVNKLPKKVNGIELPAFSTLEEAVDLIFCNHIWMARNNDSFRKFSGMNVEDEVSLGSIKINSISCKLNQIHAVSGLAWIGKGLLMRGHEKVKDVVMTFLNCLLSKENDGVYSSNDQQQEMLLIKAAADAFCILLSDSEVCLNRKFHATTRPLYKQRLFNTVMPVLQSSIVKSDSSFVRSMLYRAFAHVISNTPLVVVLSEANKLIPMLLDSLSLLCEDVMNKDIIYSLLLILSGMLTENSGQEAAVENAHVIIYGLIKLVSYPHMLLIRETAIQCLVAVSRLPHIRIYPMRAQVLQTTRKALDDPKRTVRQEAVRCRRAWVSIVS